MSICSKPCARVAFASRVAAGDHVDQQAAVREPVEGRGHARRSGGRDDARPDRDQELQALGGWDQAGRDDPRVFARTTGRKQRTFVAEVVRRPSDLLHVIESDSARARRGAEITSIAVGGDEPEDIHRDSLIARMRGCAGETPPQVPSLRELPRQTSASACPAANCFYGNSSPTARARAQTAEDRDSCRAPIRPLLVRGTPHAEGD